MKTIKQQIRDNAVALISLSVALLSLGYNTWRNETTEEQRNVRHAAFRTLEALGELQQVVLYRTYYLPENADQQEEGRLRIRGFGQVQLIQDLMNLMPEPGPAAGDHLFRLWRESVDELSLGPDNQKALMAEKAITDAIDQTRDALWEVLVMLD